MFLPFPEIMIEAIPGCKLAPINKQTSIPNYLTKYLMKLCTINSLEHFLCSLTNES